MKATIVVEGTPTEVAELLRQLHDLAEVQLLFEPDSLQLPINWDEHPALGRLTAVEREIIRLDLLFEPRRRIAQQLQLTVGTVTVYRRSIRAKLRAIPPEQYPPAMQQWLRRFPGQAGAAPKPPAEPET
jgi:DNA-binding NarL/FixJ family response regulator